MNLDKLVSVARGDETADLIFKNARIINTFNGTIEEGTVAISDEYIAGIGEYKKAKEIIDLKGNYLAPGLINAHTHIESSMLHPVYYAQVVIPRGTVSVVTDLHEITNVCGFDGINFVMSWAEKLPLDMFFMAPSCVPATHMETSGAVFNVKDIKKALSFPHFLGLGEMMNFPGVINGDKQVMNKIKASRDKVIDGHSPGITGMQLNAYVSAGIRSDHECTSLYEAQEKLSRGMYIMIREGSSAKNLDELLPLVTDKTYKRCLFVVDDSHCSDLLDKGDIDAVVRKAIKKGLDPVRAIQLATLNPAEYFRLHNRGGIAPGYLANLITIIDLDNLKIDRVFYRGSLVAQGGNYLLPLPDMKLAELNDTVKIKPFAIKALELKIKGDSYLVIEIVPGQIITRKRIEKVANDKGVVIADLERDILKLVVVERHKKTGNIGIGLVKGFGIKRGALASSIAHDSHNIIAVGVNDQDIYAAIREVEKYGGGLVACSEGKILASLPLPVAGLLSDRPLAEVVRQHEELERVVSTMGNLPESPFAILSFLALPVIPELKLTDKGLIDVLQFKVISV